MLYKNDEIYDLRTRPDEIKAIEKFFHNKFPVKVVYPPNRIIPSKLKHNRKPDKPNSISFDYKAIVKTPKGTEVWRYAENVVIDEKGIKKYTPKKLIYFGTKYIGRNDIELLYFLLRKSEYRLISDEELKEDPTLVQSAIPKFAFEDLVTEAEKRADKKKLANKVDGLLYGEDFGLSEVKLRELADAYFIPGVKELTLAQVQWKLESRINETKEGAEEFFRMVNADEEIKTRKSITDAINLGILMYENTGKLKRWIWKTKEGVEAICKVPPNMSPNEALYAHYLGNEGFRDDIQAVLLTNNPHAGKKVAKKEAEEDKKEDE